jgi:[ribosomal protein S5]-alanine N-acetyltransferase
MRRWSSGASNTPRPESVRLVTPRLILRDFEDADLDDVHAFRSDPEVARFMADDVESREQAEAWLRGVIFHNRVRPRVAYNLAIELRDEGRVIGWIGIGDSERYPQPGECGFGYALNRAYWGRGYATEAAIEIVIFGFHELGAHRISAWCYEANQSSARVLAKAGLQFARRYQDVEPKSGQLAACVEYAVLLDEWLVFRSAAPT